MAITISQTTENEVEEFEREAWKPEDLKHYGGVSWDEWEPKLFTFKAEQNGKITGVASGNCIAGVLFLDRLIVSADHRGQGIGKLLLKKVEEHASSIGAHKIYFYTGKNWESNEFYLKLGYKRIGELNRHFMGKDFYVYSKLLK